MTANQSHTKVSEQLTFSCNKFLNPGMNLW